MNADEFNHPTKFTGDWPNWNGHTWLDWSKEAQCYHPGEDYNFGYGDQDCGQDVGACANGIVFHASESNLYYGNLIILKHQLGYNLKRFIKETYGIETDELYSLYAHLKDILVATGNKVECGALIAHAGKTGTKSCHTHFEIYSLWKDLKNTSYRFYPKGWPKEKIKENWLPAYQFIEATKNLESYDNFLGKPKEYWLTIEKDRENLLGQLEKKDEEFLKIKAPLDERLGKLEKENQQLANKIAKLEGNQELALVPYRNKITELEEKLGVRDEKITGLKNRIAEILADQSEAYKVGEAFILLIEAIKRRFGGDRK